MSKDIIIKAEKLGKKYKLYNKKSDRLKEAFSFTRKQYFQEYHALSNICFEIQKGEIVGIVGENGAGKSTLLKILTGVTTPSIGNVEVKGKVSALLELGAGFNPEFTGIENIYLNGTMMGYSREQMNHKIKGIIDFADIGEFINQPVKSYSSGMFSRLAFAVSINVDPDILIVDEALSVGDTRFQMKCIKKMRELMDKGTTVLFVSHDTNIIRRFCEKGIWINKGEIEIIGEVNEVVDMYNDFLKKKNGIVEELVEDNSEQKMLELWRKPFEPTAAYGEILGIRVLDEYDAEIDTMKICQPIKVQVVYDVYDEPIEAPVLGVAVFGVNNEYLCGVNTLLDNKKIPWKYGRNVATINYTQGLTLLGGQYSFTVALFDKTATVSIDFKSDILKFTIKDRYLGEGKFIIPHRWEY